MRPRETMNTAPEAAGSPGGAVSSAIETLELLLHLTEKNGSTIALIFPEETGDFLRGYVAGQIDAFRLALEHIKDIKEN
jgi:hypothetical protein